MWEGKRERTSAISEVFSERCVWIGRFDSWARAPRAERRGDVQEGTKRGVMIGETRAWVGSMLSM